MHFFLGYKYFSYILVTSCVIQLSFGYVGAFELVCKVHRARVSNCPLVDACVKRCKFEGSKDGYCSRVAPLACCCVNVTKPPAGKIIDPMLNDGSGAN